MQTRAKRVVVVVFDEVDLLDVSAPLALLTQAGRRWNFRPFRVELAAPAPGLVTTRNQFRFEAPFALDAVEPGEIVLVPGGYGARRLGETPALAAAVARVARDAELVAAIGWGVFALAAAGLVGSRRVAAGPEIEAPLRVAAPAAALDSTLDPVFDAPLLTARAGGAGLAIGLGLVEKSFGPKLRSMVESDLCLEATRRLEIVPGPKTPATSRDDSSD
jgi:transcriptional regulator GlxA family with amidase domain